jgi:hypothetical protein
MHVQVAERARFPSVLIVIAARAAHIRPHHREVKSAQLILPIKRTPLGADFKIE